MNIMLIYVFAYVLLRVFVMNVDPVSRYRNKQYWEC
jgi:hypothetical protein